MVAVKMVVAPLTGGLGATVNAVVVLTVAVPADVATVGDVLVLYVVSPE
jgi:hypothetical protein